MTTARDVVTRRIAFEAKRFPDLDFEPLNTNGLDARDAGLARAIDQAVRRHWLALATVCESVMDKPWDSLEPRMQAVLLTGSAQLLLLDRIPEHAIVNDSVKWAKNHIRTKAAGFVNAILHKVAHLRKELLSFKVNDTLRPDQFIRSDGKVWQLTSSIYSSTPHVSIAQQTSHPTFLCTRWNKRFGEVKAREIMLHSLVQPPIVVHGVQANLLPELTPHDEDGFLTFTGSHARLVNILTSHPTVIVQDVTSSLPVTALSTLDPLPGTIIDFCAGMGTKAKQLANAFPSARIIASDVNEKRLEVLRANFNDQERVTVADHAELRNFAGQGDVVVLDVPCSNTGVLARRVEAKYRFCEKSLNDLVSRQRQVIADAIPLLSPRGHILYSTCSLEKEENEEIANWIVKWHNMKIVKSGFRIPTAQPGETPNRYSDGGYFAVLTRR